jgi:hypothetical protein
LQALVHPGTLLCIALLAINDHVLFGGLTIGSALAWSGGAIRTLEIAYSMMALAAIAVVAVWWISTGRALIALGGRAAGVGNRRPGGGFTRS